MIADGDERDRMLVCDVLQGAGYETLGLSTGSATLAAVRANNVALIVLEVDLPDMTGYEVCREIRSTRGDDLPVFFLSGLRTEPLDRVAGLLMGADDFIVKPFDAKELVARVQRFVDRRRPAAERENGVPQLTPREIEILDLLVTGRRHKEIATQLVISQKTVATHIQNMLGKFGVHSRAELVARAYALGCVSNGAPGAHAYAARSMS